MKLQISTQLNIDIYLAAYNSKEKKKEKRYTFTWSVSCTYSDWLRMFFRFMFSPLSPAVKLHSP